MQGDLLQPHCGHQYDNEQLLTGQIMSHDAVFVVADLRTSLRSGLGSREEAGAKHLAAALLFGTGSCRELRAF